MKPSIAVALVALATAFGGTVRATPLEQLRDTPASMLEFGSFRLEAGLAGVKDWPVPIEGAGVAAKADPEQIEIVIAVRKVGADVFRAVCAKTVGRVRQFLYVDADGAAPMGRSSLGSYFRGPWSGSAREVALRSLDAITVIRVNVVGSGSCHAALLKGAVTF
jgi:hypothetical protein